MPGGDLSVRLLIDVPGGSVPAGRPTALVAPARPTVRPAIAVPPRPAPILRPGPPA